MSLYILGLVQEDKYNGDSDLRKIAGEKRVARTTDDGSDKSGEFPFSYIAFQRHTRVTEARNGDIAPEIDRESPIKRGRINNCHFYLPKSRYRGFC
jgi:hypothetical protein